MDEADEVSHLIKQLKSKNKRTSNQAITALRDSGYFYDGTLAKINLAGIDLSDLDLNQIYLGDANLRGANLNGTSFREANLLFADFSWTDLTEADLSDSFSQGTNFSDANMTKALLIKSDLSGAQLKRASLIGARLGDANLTFADLSKADLTGCGLQATILYETVLDDAKLTGASCARTIFAGVDLSRTKGLDSIQHSDRSDVGIETLIRSKGNISDEFLRGCGIPDSFIAFVKSLAEHPKSLSLNPQIYVSYNRKDWDEFVQPLVSHLRPLGFNTWIDQRYLGGGDDWMDKINEALDESKYMILCISSDALESKYVKMEYRYFYNNNKPIIPVICRQVDRLPAELQGIQYQPYDLDAIADRLRTLIDTEGAKEPSPIPKL